MSDDPRAFPALTPAGGIGVLAAAGVTPAAVPLVLLRSTVMGPGVSRELWLSVLLIASCAERGVRRARSSSGS